ncbi:MAG: cyclic nucleotide-binding domain-containing protein [Butyrivibrio sp.]|nr:cyclic nucleotide-binding domain-containing protein [Butyrivibrio sp.]
MANNEQQSAIMAGFDDRRVILTFPAESLILKEGDRNVDMYKIIQGQAEMYVGYGTDKESLLGIAGPDSCFGELGLLLGTPSIYTVIAYTDVSVLRVTSDRIASFVKENQTSTLQIMRNMAETMSVMQHQIMDLSEEINTLKNKEENDNSELEKEIIKSYVRPQGMKGKMYFMGRGKH